MNEHDLQPFLAPKFFHGSFELADHTYEVAIETPDLSKCPRTVWGDWGPMYSFELGERATVSVTYRSAELWLSEELWLSSIELNSPMLCERRQRHPLCLEFKDDERGLAFCLYLDREAQPAKLEVKSVRTESEIAASLGPNRTSGQHVVMPLDEQMACA